MSFFAWPPIFLNVHRDSLVTISSVIQELLMSRMIELLDSYFKIVWKRIDELQPVSFKILGDFVPAFLSTEGRVFRGSSDSTQKRLHLKIFDVFNTSCNSAEHPVRYWLIVTNSANRSVFTWCSTLQQYDRLFSWKLQLKIVFVIFFIWA